MKINHSASWWKKRFDLEGDSEIGAGNPNFEEEIDKPREEIKCPKCKIGFLGIWHDIHGMYHKCDHCGWDSLGLYKTRNKYSKVI